MRISMAFFAVLFVSSQALDAATEDGFYVELDLGLSSISDVGVTTSESLDFDGGVTFGGAFGYRFLHHYRGELNISSRKADVDSVNGEAATGDVSVTNFMANIYYDFDLESPLKLYLGAGLGSASVDVDATATSMSGAIDESDGGAFAFNVMAGASYPVHESIDLCLGYRYLGTRDLFSSNLDLHEFLVGVRYSF
jgi:opacity protein-like surface antigen